MAATWVNRFLNRSVAPYALHRAVRAAVVVPVNFAIGSQLIGDPQLATFAAFGSFALLLFVDFPGSRASRLADYAMLGITGVVLISLGTLVAKPDWLAVVSMAVVAFIVLFAGVVSSVTAAAGRAAMLTFILPVMLPGTVGSLPYRLGGWGIAFAVSVPVALFLWPPKEQSQLRAKTAAALRAQAAMLRLDPPAPGAGDPLVAMMRSVGELRAAFRASASRPVALSTGSRLLMRLVDEVEWLTTTVTHACADAPESWPEHGRRLRTAAADTLASCAGVLDHDGSGPSRLGCDDLDICIGRLGSARAAVAAETLAELRSASRAGAPAASRVTSVASGIGDAGEFQRPLYAAHELGYTVELTARTVAVIAAADSRPWFDRLLGRKPAAYTLTVTEPGTEDDAADPVSTIPAMIEPGEAAAAERIAVSHFDRRSVWLQSSVRGAAGLAGAVLIARISGQQEGFWIVLGALSVLRSNALTIGATALRAVLGTVVGFVIGGLIVGLIGTNPDVLWPMLPVAIFIAAFAPEAISFVAGQAAFTVVVIILFNIIAPNGWQIGVLRVEDVALGCAASVLAGLLLWPRGAGAALGGALSDSYRAGSVYLREAVEYVTGRRDIVPDHVAAEGSGYRLDDALRQYLAERGAKHLRLEDVTALANGATRLRLAAVAVKRLRVAAPDNGGTELAAPIAVLTDRAGEVTAWYATLADVVSGGTTPLPPVGEAPPRDSFLDVVLPVVDSGRAPGEAEHAERLLWSGQYLGDVDQVRADLVGPAEQIRAARQSPWWAR